MLCHDGTDIILCIGRVYSEFKYRKIIVIYIMYAFMFIFWFYLRIYVYPTQIVYHTIKFAMQSKRNHNITPALKQVLSLSNFILTMLMILVIMNIYWTVFMIKGLQQQIF